MEVHALEEEGQENGDTRGVSPVPLKISSNRKLGQDVNTGIPHTSIGEVSSAGIKSAGSIGVGENSVTGLKEGERNEHGANL